MPNRFIQDIVKEMSERVEDIIRKMADEESAKVAKELLPAIKKEWEDEYREAAAKWYGSYSPVYYKRRYSLYELMEVEIDEGEGSVSGRAYFDRNDAYTGRNHYHLFDTVFMEGWHGGPLIFGRRLATRTEPPVELYEKNKAKLEEKYAKLIESRTEERVYEKLGKLGLG